VDLIEVAAHELLAVAQPQLGNAVVAGQVVAVLAEHEDVVHRRVDQGEVVALAFLQGRLGLLELGEIA
jgi:hypothetical protein